MIHEPVAENAYGFEIDHGDSVPNELIQQNNTSQKTEKRK